MAPDALWRRVQYAYDDGEMDALVADEHCGGDEQKTLPDWDSPRAVAGVGSVRQLAPLWSPPSDSGSGSSGSGWGAARGGRSGLRASRPRMWRPRGGLPRLRSPAHRGRQRCQSCPLRCRPRRARRGPLPRRRPTPPARRRGRRCLPGRVCEGSSRHRKGLRMRQARSMTGREGMLEDHAGVKTHAVTLQKC